MKWPAHRMRKVLNNAILGGLVSDDMIKAAEQALSDGFQGSLSRWDPSSGLLVMKRVSTLDSRLVLSLAVLHLHTGIMSLQVDRSHFYKSIIMTSCGDGPFGSCVTAGRVRWHQTSKNVWPVIYCWQLHASFHFDHICSL